MYVHTAVVVIEISPSWSLKVMDPSKRRRTSTDYIVSHFRRYVFILETFAIYISTTVSVV
jgi:hypothetical protein